MSQTYPPPSPMTIQVTWYWGGHLLPVVSLVGLVAMWLWSTPVLLRQKNRLASAAPVLLPDFYLIYIGFCCLDPVGIHCLPFLLSIYSPSFVVGALVNMGSCPVLAPQ